jgi:hypothetical protein
MAARPAVFHALGALLTFRTLGALGPIMPLVPLQTLGAILAPVGAAVLAAVFTAVGPAVFAPIGLAVFPAVDLAVFAAVLLPHILRGGDSGGGKRGDGEAKGADLQHEAGLLEWLQGTSCKCSCSMRGKLSHVKYFCVKLSHAYTGE